MEPFIIIITFALGLIIARLTCKATEGCGGSNGDVERKGVRLPDSEA